MNVADICRDLAPTPASYSKVRRRIVAEAEGLRPLRMAVVATCTLHTFEHVLFVEVALRGLLLEPWFAPFGQLEAPVLDGGGPLYAHSPDVLFVFARIDDLLPVEMRRFLTLGESGQQSALDSLAGRLRGIMEAFRARSGARILVANFAADMFAAGLADAGLAGSQAAFLHRANGMLSAICREVPGASVFDFAQLSAQHGSRTLGDPRLRHMARVPFGVGGQIAFSRRLARTLFAATQPSAKVLVLDLDNTLWGGIVGEDGAGGVQLGDDYPGSVFKEFQHYVLSLRDRGVILALASKNNEPDVAEVFDHHRDCVLQRGDFSALRINWDRKSVSIASIASELNVGLDAVVFFDDSPAEREEVRAALPAVHVIEVPAEPMGYIDAVEESGFFDVLAISADDRVRADSYVARAAAAELQATSPGEFLRSLGMTVTLGAVGALTLPRVVQLIGKTNQFNLTSRRHGEADVQRMIEDGGIVMWARVEDRFGDHGLIAVAIALPCGGGRWRMDSLLMSCRVIGRGVERVLIAKVAAEVVRRGGKDLLGEYLPTPKNAQVAEFYADIGFVPQGEGFWLCDLIAALPELPEFIRVEVQP